MPPSPHAEQVSCPKCVQRTATRLDGISRGSHVDYFRCDRCGHVWITEKGTETPVRDVTHATRSPQRH